MDNDSIKILTTVILPFVCSGTMGALITALLTRRKTKSESKKIDAETEGLDIQNDLQRFDFINKRLQEISDNATSESVALRARNDELDKQIAELNNKLQLIMEWVMYDNQQYRVWLETQLHQVKPDLQFPICAAPPKIFGSQQ